MELEIKYNKIAGFFLILVSFLILAFVILLFINSNNYSVLLFGLIMLIGIYIGQAYLFDKNAITIKNYKFKTGYGLNNIEIDLRDIQEIILDKKYFPELLIILKDEKELNIKLTPLQKFLNLVMKVKIGRNAIRIFSYQIKYNLEQLEKELNEELEKLK